MTSASHAGHFGHVKLIQRLLPRMWHLPCSIPVQAHLLLSIHQTLHLSSFLLWLYRTLRAGPSLNCRFGQLLLGEVGWRSSKRVYAKFKVDFTSKTFLLRRRGLAMGSSYAVLLLFFSFEGAQSYYHVQLFETKNTPKMWKKWMQQLYHWNFKGRLQKNFLHFWWCF